MLDPHPFHMVGEKYLSALVSAADALPWMVPLLVEAPVIDELLEHVDGVFLTGSYSNVEPRHYGGEPSRPGTLHDPERDATTLPLIRRALAEGMPVFAVCRGFQELNVALGGSLHQHVEEVAGYRDHREDPDEPLDVQYGPAHAVDIVADGLLHRIAGVGRATVNSLHSQGVARLADGATVEARADDGLVEAFSVGGQSGFCLAVQWHPEWKVGENPLSQALFGAFGEAARQYAAERPARKQTASLLSALGTAGES